MVKTYRPYVPEQDLLLPPSLLIDRCSFPKGRRFDLTVTSRDRSKDVS